MDNLKRYNEIFKKVLLINDEKLNDELSVMSLDNWDSVAQMQLILALEDEFNIMIETEDMVELTSYQVGKIILQKYGVNIGE